MKMHVHQSCRLGHPISMLRGRHVGWPPVTEALEELSFSLLELLSRRGRACKHLAVGGINTLSQSGKRGYVSTCEPLSARRPAVVGYGSSTERVDGRLAGHMHAETKRASSPRDAVGCCQFSLCWRAALSRVRERYSNYMVVTYRRKRSE
jgi:hypothetical protein